MQNPQRYSKCGRTLKKACLLPWMSCAPFKGSCAMWQSREPGVWREGKMVYQGHVALGVSRMAAGRFPTSPACPFEKYHRGTRTLSGIARRSTAPLSIWSEPASTACGKRSSRGFGRMGRAGAGELPCRTILFLKSANK